MSVLKKVNIDDLVILLAQMRKTTSFVDMAIEPGNILKIRPADEPVKKAKEDNDLLDNLNQLLG